MTFADIVSISTPIITAIITAICTVFIALYHKEKEILKLIEETKETFATQIDLNRAEDLKNHYQLKEIIAKIHYRLADLKKDFDHENKTSKTELDNSDKQIKNQIILLHNRITDLEKYMKNDYHKERPFHIKKTIDPFKDTFSGHQ